MKKNLDVTAEISQAMLRQETKREAIRREYDGHVAFGRFEEAQECRREMGFIDGYLSIMKGVLKAEMADNQDRF